MRGIRFLYLCLLFMVTLVHPIFYGIKKNRTLSVVLFEYSIFLIIK
jgi:hypothetical protein